MTEGVLAVGTEAAGEVVDSPLGIALPLAMGDGKIVLDTGHGEVILEGGAEVSTVWLTFNGATEEFSGGPGHAVLISGSYANTLIGGPGANTFVLSAGVESGATPLVQVENFNPAHDTIVLPAALYAGVGANDNVVVLSNDAAAANYAGADPAVLVVGSGTNADVYYYNPNDPNHGNQAHAYQLAVVDNATASDVAAHLSFGSSAHFGAHTSIA